MFCVLWCFFRESRGRHKTLAEPSGMCRNEQEIDEVLVSFSTSNDNFAQLFY